MAKKLLLSIATLLIWSHTTFVQCDLLDPGLMFGTENNDNNDNIKELGGEPPFPLNEVDQTDSSCSVGSEIVLKRIVRKLFNQLHRLQPTELDDEFIYQSTITYGDYLDMMKYLNGERLNCATLHKLDTILSSFLTMAEVSRPSQNSHLTNFIEIDIVSMQRAFSQLPNIYLIVTLLSVCLLSYTFSRLRKSFLWAFGIVGFVQFLMQQHSMSVNNHQEKLDRCINPTNFAKVLAYFNYDYDGCRDVATSSPHLFDTNVAVVLSQFLSELFSKPLIPLASSIGAACQTYLNQWSYLNQWFLGPIILILILAAITSIIACTIIHFFKYRHPSHQLTVNQVKRANSSIKSSKKPSIENGSPKKKK